jgi:predicted phosphoribosyltransferase
MRFASRQDAGRKLANFLVEKGIRADVILGLPRGGVVVAAEVADVLQVPMDVLLVRKIGHPRHREFAVGALGEGGVVLLDRNAIGVDAALRQEVNAVIREETNRLGEYELKFRDGRKLDLASKAAMIVDDGLATGATTEAAVLSAKARGCWRVVVAVPVASTHAMDRLAQVADDVVAIVVDPDFEAVGAYYDSFPQTSDDEVLALLQPAPR